MARTDGDVQIAPPCPTGTGPGLTPGDAIS